MVVWLVFAGMTLIAGGLLLWPLRRTNSAVPAGDPHVTVYRAQVAEIERDEESGRIGAADAQAAKTESARRLVSENRSSRPASSSSGSRRILAGVLVVASLGSGALLYGLIGSPNLPDAPLAARTMPADGANVADALARIEAHLAREPDDRRGWTVIAPVYLRMGRTDDAVRAYRQIVRLHRNADSLADLAEAQIHAAAGVVKADARRGLDAALSLDPKHMKARYYIGLAAEQDGDRARARDLWTALAADAPAGSRLATGLAERIAALDTAPATADVAALPAPERQSAIRGMVERLAGRLRETGGGLDEWLRLVRAYRVLDETDKARSALADARKSFVGDSAAASRLDDLARELGLEG